MPIHDGAEGTAHQALAAGHALVLVDHGLAVVIALDGVHAASRHAGDYTKAEDLPYIIVPGDKALHRESIFLERAIAGERVRLAMGLSIRPIAEKCQSWRAAFLTKKSRTLLQEWMK